MEEMEYVSFFIPKFLWEGEEALSRDECFVLSAITSLDNDEKGCFASNEYLAKYCRCSDRTITNAISALKKKGFITIDKPQSAYRSIHSILNKPSSPQPVRSKSASGAELVRSRCGVKSASGATYYYSINNKENTSPLYISPQGAEEQEKEEQIKAIQQFYNENRGNMPECSLLSPKRKSLIAARLADSGEATVQRVITLAATNNFLQGNISLKDGKTFVASIDWLMNPNNFAKVIDGAYAQHQAPPKSLIDKQFDEIFGG